MKLLTAKEVAAFFRVTLRTISRWVDSGLLPAHKIGTVVRFDEEALQALLKRQVKKE